MYLRTKINTNSVVCYLEHADYIYLIRHEALLMLCFRTWSLDLAAAELDEDEETEEETAEMEDTEATSENSPRQRMSRLASTLDSTLVTFRPAPTGWPSSPPRRKARSRL